MSGSGFIALFNVSMFSFNTFSLNRINLTGFSGTYIFQNVTRDTSIDIINGTPFTQNGYFPGVSLGDTRDQLLLNRLDDSTATTG